MEYEPAPLERREADSGKDCVRAKRGGNLSSTTNFHPPNLNTAAASTTAPVDAACGARMIGTSVPSRDIQFALKYNF
jgi:hypothetical protein